MVGWRGQHRERMGRVFLYRRQRASGQDLDHSRDERRLNRRRISWFEDGFGTLQLLSQLATQWKRRDSKSQGVNLHCTLRFCPLCWSWSR